MHSSRLFTLTLGALMLACSSEPELPAPAPAPSLPTPGR